MRPSFFSWQILVTCQVYLIKSLGDDVELVAAFPLAPHLEDLLDRLLDVEGEILWIIAYFARHPLLWWLDLDNACMVGVVGLQVGDKFGEV